MLKIVLIEPVHNHKKVYVNILKKNSFQVLDFKSDAIAKIFLKNNKPDLIIAGCCLSAEDTRNLIDEIKASNDNQNIKFLKICPNKKSQCCQNLIKHGLDDYIMLTEFSVDTFLRKIYNLFDISPVVEIKKYMNNKDTDLNHIDHPVKQKSNNNHSSIEKEILDKLITQEELEKRLKKAFSARAIPHIVSELLDLTSTLNSDINQLIHCIELDPALTARVLKCSNSAYYRGNKGKIYNLKDSIKTMGFNGLKDLVMGIGILDSFSNGNSESSFSRLKFWYHSISTGVIAREIANSTNHERPDTLFLLGILHDIGTALFDEYFHKEFDMVLQYAEKHNVSLIKAEKKLIGMDHYELAGLVLKSWGFPEHILLPMMNISKSFEDITKSVHKLKEETEILKLSDYLANFVGSILIETEELSLPKQNLLSKLNIKSERLNEILINAREHTKELIQIMLLHMNPGELADCDTINKYASLKQKEIMLFDSDNQNFIPLGVLLKILNHNITSRNNMFMLPDTSKIDAIIINCSDNANIAEVIALLKKLDKLSDNNMNTCIIANEFNIQKFKSINDLPDYINYINKPFSMNNIFETINKLLKTTEKSLVSTN